jgi:hypothetical protein
MNFCPPDNDADDEQQHGIAAFNWRNVLRTFV